MFQILKVHYQQKQYCRLHSDWVLNSIWMEFTGQMMKLENSSHYNLKMRRNYATVWEAAKHCVAPVTMGELL